MADCCDCSDRDGGGGGRSRIAPNPFIVLRRHLQLELENRTLFRSGDVSIESEESDNAYLTAAAMKTKIRLLQSRPLLEDVVASLRLDQNSTFQEVTQRKNILESIQTITGKFKGSGTPAAPPSLYIETPPAPSPENLLARTAQESARLISVRRNPERRVKRGTNRRNSVVDDLV